MKYSVLWFEYALWLKQPIPNTYLFTCVVLVYQIWNKNSQISKLLQLTGNDIMLLLQSLISNLHFTSSRSGILFISIWPARFQINIRNYKGKTNKSIRWSRQKKRRKKVDVGHYLCITTTYGCFCYNFSNENRIWHYDGALL